MSSCIQPQGVLLMCFPCNVNHNRSPEFLCSVLRYSIVQGNTPCWTITLCVNVETQKPEVLMRNEGFLLQGKVCMRAFTLLGHWWKKNYTEVKKRVDIYCNIRNLYLFNNGHYLLELILNFLTFVETSLCGCLAPSKFYLLSNFKYLFVLWFMWLGHRNNSISLGFNKILCLYLLKKSFDISEKYSYLLSWQEGLKMCCSYSHQFI